MLGMSFGAFVVILAVSLIAAFVLHYLFSYRCLPGGDGFLAQWMVGWIGAWLGSPVVGDWFAHFELAGVYLIPALVGAFSLAFLATAAVRALGNGRVPAPTTHQ